MAEDYFASYTISSVLTWVICLPAMIGAAGMAISFTFDRMVGVPRWLSIWFGICLLVFSPVRYLVWQMTAAVAYPFQSLWALWTTGILALYVPIVFSLLWAIAVGLPILVLAWIGMRSGVGGFRRLMTAVVCPIVCYATTVLFTLLLPYAALTTHWLRAEDVIRASNGPASYMFWYFSAWGLPLQVPRYAEDAGKTDRDMYRGHVASLYLGEREETRYIAKAYPNYYREVTSGNPEPQR